MASDLARLLRPLPLFRALSDEELGRLVDMGRLEYWQRGSVVLEQGAFGPRMMVLVEGRVEVLRRDAEGVHHAIADLGSGEVLGEISLLLDLPRCATARAVTALRVFAIDKSAFQDLLDRDDPAALKFAVEVARALATRLIKLNDLVVALLSESEALKERFSAARQEAFPLWDDG
jgi:CRP-like cAMP-binding protein